MKRKSTEAEQTLDHLEMLESVGTGAFSTVFRARRRKDGEIVAVKQQSNEGRHGDANTAVVLREIAALSALAECPNVIPLYEVLSEWHQVFMVMKFVPRTLRQVWSDHSQPLPETRIRHLLRQLLTALAFTHSRGFLHRDVKPDNVVVAEDDHLYLVDFGLAAFSGRAPHAPVPLIGEVCTIGYRDPWLMQLNASYTRAIDLWSVGCLAIEMFTRRALFSEMDISEREMMLVVYKAFGSPPPGLYTDMYPDLPFYPVRPMADLLPVGTSAAAVNLITGLLEYDPVRRLTAAAALAHPFFSSDTRAE